MKLIIAEKPSVANGIAPVIGAIQKRNGYVEGNGYLVSWCYGHLIGLKEPNEYGGEWAEKPWKFEMLPMFPTNWQLKIKPDKKEQLMILKKLMNDDRVDEIICATDADREGELIFRYVYMMCGCKKPVKRLWISSLEEDAVRNGMKSLKNSSEYAALYQAGFCRAKADWLVGMNGSRLFSVRYRSTLSMGRVQTPTLAMIVKRDNDVKNFVKKKYFTVGLNCGSFIADSDRIDDENKADALVALVNGYKRGSRTYSFPSWIMSFIMVYSDPSFFRCRSSDLSFLCCMVFGPANSAYTKSGRENEPFRMSGRFWRPNGRYGDRFCR